MSEKNGGGYRELEKDIIEKRINEFVSANVSDNDIFQSDNFDPRVVETERITKQYGFSMTEGQYYDLLK